MNEKDFALEFCKALIEGKLAWGKSDGWTNRDFAELGERVFAETGVHLSHTTLKRLWGKIEYNSSPHPDTLEALAVFAGFENWRSLKRSAAAPAGNAADPEPIDKKQRFYGRKKQLLVVAVATIATALPVLWWAFSKQALAPEDFSFSSRVLSAGIPNSVVFHYDARAAPPGDSIFIQQSWDKRRRIPVSRGAQEHTAVYYYPGYFMAKLVVGGQVVREHKLFIPTDGWLAYIEQSPVPVYLDRADFDRDSCLEVPPELVAAYNIPLQPEAPTVCFTEVRQRDNLRTDNFLLEAELKNLFGEGSAVCRLSEVVLLTSRGPLVIPLSAPGCVGTLVMHVPHDNIGADEADFSGFGCDLSRWTAVRFSAQGSGKIAIAVQGKPAFSLDWAGDASDITGVQFNFKGGGAVRRVRLSSANRRLKSD